MEPIRIEENGLVLLVNLDSAARPRLVYAGLAEHAPGGIPVASDACQMFQVQGEHQNANYYCTGGAKQYLSLPGLDLAYRSHSCERTTSGLKVELRAATAAGLEATQHWQFYDGIPVVRSWVELQNKGPHPVGLEQVASFFLWGLDGGREDWYHGCDLHVCHGGWFSELRWSQRRMSSYGLDRPRTQNTYRVRIANTGNWSCKEYHPMGVLEDRVRGCATVWQIENNGSWSYELGDVNKHLYLLAQGPDEQSSHWYKELQPGETFSSAPVAIGFLAGAFEQAMQALTCYRRAMRRPHPDYARLPIIFNDYMNCLFADPSTAKERPLIETARACGAEYFVIDAGWYSPPGQGWWSTIGEWRPAEERFDGGIRGILDEIRRAGMVPGLWLELESMGVDCPLTREWPDECFFCRHGRRVISKGRLQLDFRNARVLSHADEVVDRLVDDYGVGYIKMDYNIDMGSGTDANACSSGDGLQEHARAYLDWVEGVYERYPHLVIENCSSGGMRMDYAMLRLHTIQSSSDQEDYRLIARIAAASATGATPEQQAVWACPKEGSSDEEVVMNMVNAMLSRIHLAGRIDTLTDSQRGLITDALRVYGEMRQHLSRAVPFWPLGVVGPDDTVFAAGLGTKERAYLACWNVGDEATEIAIPLPGFPGECSTRMLYPEGRGSSVWDAASSRLIVGFDTACCARLVELTALQQPLPVG